MTRIPLSNLRAANLQLGDDDVHIWWARQDLPDTRLRELEESLCDDERTRAERFRFERDRNRFIAARGILREILANYLGVESKTILFAYGKNGKPRLGDKFASQGIEFSVSHSEGNALYGFCRNRQIGVDIESIRVLPEMNLIATRFFSNGENEILCRLQGSQKLNGFFRLWTRKEAFIKAIGFGLSYPLESFDVSLNPVKPAENPRFDGGGRTDSEWSIQDVEIISYYAAAFAIKSRRFEAKHWRYEVG